MEKNFEDNTTFKSNIIKPFFSIIIPVYNVKDYISECVNSVIKQNFFDYEVILIDDGSNDGSELLCDEYSKKHKNIKAIHIKNSGPGKARNVGIENAKGKYIIFLDSDDMLISESLSKLEKIMKKTEKDVYLGQKFKILFPRGKTEDRVNEIKFDISKADNLLKNLLLYSNISLTYIWRNVYNLSFIKKNNIYFEENVLCSEDLDWNTRVFLLAKKVDKIDFYTHIYRGNRIGSIVTTSSPRRVNDFLTNVNKWIDLSNEYEENLSYLIKKFYSNGFYTNLKYIYGYNKTERNKLIDKVEKSDFWYYYNKRNRKIYIIKKVLGTRMLLRILNCKYRTFMVIKKALIKLNVLDR